MTFKLYDCDFGFKYNSVDYQFDHVDNLTIETTRATKLVRGANAKNKMGLVYEEGGKEPDRMSVTILGMDAALKAVLDQAYENKDRLDPYCINRIDGSSKIGKNAILSQRPQQLTLDDSPDSLNVVLMFETFDLVEKHKS